MSRLPLWHIRWCSASGHKQLSALAGCTQSVGLGCLPSVGTVSFCEVRLSNAVVPGPCGRTSRVRHAGAVLVWQLQAEEQSL